MFQIDITRLKFGVAAWGVQSLLLLRNVSRELCIGTMWNDMMSNLPCGEKFTIIYAHALHYGHIERSYAK